VLSPRIFEFLEENIRMNLREGGLFQLTSCLDRLRREEGIVACVVKGKRFNIGSPQAYLDSLVGFRGA
jgi:UTP--glucose-1-phosphate uridylyltransferase